MMDGSRLRQGAHSREQQRPTVWGLFLIFSQIGLTSFGGGLSGWFLRAFVEERKWLSEDEFLNGVSLCQALPGINSKNQAIWIGYRLLGWRGAVAGFAGIIIPPAIFIVLLGVLFSSLSGFRITQLAMDGATAAAIGLSLSMGIKTARRVQRSLFPITVLIATFLFVGVFRWPLLWVLIGVGSLSVAAEYAKLRRG
jgi:chromate transporter